MSGEYYHWLQTLIMARSYLPNLMRLFKLNNKGVEVGVEKGEFSEVLLSHSNLLILYSVDSWKEFPKEGFDDPANLSQAEHDANKADCHERLGRFGDRSNMLHMLSNDAALLFKDDELDFVYIDADHRYEHVKEDVSTWYPKVKRGGIIAGHDYFNGEKYDIEFGVKAAVDAFFSKANEKVFSTNETFPSWYVLKGETWPK